MEKSPTFIESENTSCVPSDFQEAINYANFMGIKFDQKEHDINTDVFSFSQIIGSNGFDVFINKENSCSFISEMRKVFQRADSGVKQGTLSENALKYAFQIRRDNISRLFPEDSNGFAVFEEEFLFLFEAH